MSGQAETTIPANQDIPVHFLNWLPADIMPEVSLEHFMVLNQNVYGSGIMGSEDTAGNLYGFFLLINFFNSLKKWEDPNKFAIPTLYYISLKDPDRVSDHLTQTRSALVRYIEHQHKGGLSELDLDDMLCRLKDLIEPWLPYLWFELLESPTKDLTIQDLEAVIERCSVEIFDNSDLQTIKTTLVKLYTELDTFSLKYKVPYKTNLCVICSLLQSAIMGSADLTQYIPDYMETMVMLQFRQSSV